MAYIDNLPEDVAHLIRTRYFCEFATLSKAGAPIDTPLVPFTSDDLETIDSATGLAYPVKAERARRNPKVGLLFEGGEDEPVVSISGMAAVRDRDFQANLERYLSEQILTGFLDPNVIDYENVTRKAIWYFTRILICVKPAVVRWWSNPAVMDGRPREWRAPDGTVYPQSDPAPSGGATNAPWRKQSSWRDLAQGAIARGAPAHLTLVDAEGFPLSIRAREVRATNEGFRLAMPDWLPWSGGKASVSFEGIEIFIGEARFDGREALVRVERALPVHPLMADPSEILNPRPETRDALMARIERELERRGSPLPRMPDHAPEPTAGARYRADAAFAFQGFSSAES